MTLNTGKVSMIASLRFSIEYRMSEQHLVSHKILRCLSTLLLLVLLLLLFKIMSKLLMAFSYFDRAIAASLQAGGESTPPVQRPLPSLPTRRDDDDDAQLQLALQLSQQESQAALDQQRQEDEELERILQLSLTEK
jgi:hypothetical protein